MIGLSSFILGSPMTDDLTKHFPAVAELGYGLVEIAYQNPELVHAPLIKRAAEEVGLKLAVAGDFTGGRNISSGSPAQRRDALAYLAECIEFAAALGAKVVAGPMYSAVGLAQPASPSERLRQWDHAVQGLKSAAARGDALGIALAVEPLNRFESDLVNTVDQALRMCAEVGASNVGVALDTFHMNIEEESLTGAIIAAAGKILSFQASENTRGTPGAGHIPWDQVLTALARSGYTGAVIVEAFKTDDDPALAGTLSLWRPVFGSPRQLQRDAIDFLSARWGAGTSAGVPAPAPSDKPIGRT
ncbi:MAG: sugar phosphate isomerase/epimerase [Bifidobacteriaceae bacterium]|jgi:D-psicose/D-tagatose/L-ribulose 3-epimerase|nr:sugar phosphate isomerase/epimerase [Bifidobacteriaceae bacterium]